MRTLASRSLNVRSCADSERSRAAGIGRILPYVAWLCTHFEKADRSWPIVPYELLPSGRPATSSSLPVDLRSPA